jgi:hypothetical protein
MYPFIFINKSSEKEEGRSLEIQNSFHDKLFFFLKKKFSQKLFLLLLLFMLEI